MRKQSAGLFGLLIAMFLVSPARGQEEGGRFNLHIGGGIGTPLNPTANFAGVSGAFEAGGGPNITGRQLVVGEFLWQGLPANHNTVAAISNLTCASVNPFSATSSKPCAVHTDKNLYALTANYEYRIQGRRFGWYGIVGGGWYYRYGSLQNTTAAPGTVCEPVWDWYGYTCVNGLVSTSSTLVSKGQSSGGINGGMGFMVKLGDADSGAFKFYVEGRYHYSPQGGRISTQIVPVMMGLRW